MGPSLTTADDNYTTNTTTTAALTFDVTVILTALPLVSAHPHADSRRSIEMVVVALVVVAGSKRRQRCGGSRQ